MVGLSKDLSRERAALDQFNRLFDYNPSPMAVNAFADKTFTNVNRAFLDVLHYSRAEVIGKTPNEIQLFEDSDTHRLVVDDLVTLGQIRNVELRLRRKDGVMLNGLFSGVIVESQGDRSLLTVMVDITEQVQLKHEAEKQRERLANVLKGTNAGSWEWNIQSGEVVFNERWAEMIGYTLDELAPISIETWLKLAHPEDLAESQRQLIAHFEGHSEFYACEARLRHKSGEWIWVRDHGKVAVRDQQGNPLIMFGTHIDITCAKRSSEQVRELSIRDSLTGLFNRRYVLGQLATLLEKCRRGIATCSVAMLDLDDFKVVNDHHGHVAGDLVLKDFAQLLCTNLRPTDLVGRYGGEEFLVVFENTDTATCSKVLTRLLALVAEHCWSFETGEVRMRFSGGVAESSKLNDLMTAEVIIDQADRLLYKAKFAGRNQIFFNAGPQQDLPQS